MRKQYREMQRKWSKFPKLRCRTGFSADIGKFVLLLREFYSRADISPDTLLQKNRSQ